MLNIYRVDILENKLKELTEIASGIQGVVIVSTEGFVVASYNPPHQMGAISSPQVAAMAATLIALGEQTLTRLDQGRVERFLIEGEYGSMIVHPINDTTALAIMVQKKIRIGVTLLAVSKIVADLEILLQGSINPATANFFMSY